MVQQQSQQAEILVVDDNPLITNVLQSLFGSQGYRVYCAGNGEEAIDLLKGQGVDLIVCDVMMPVMDGYELHTKVREQADLAHIPFVFLTALGDGVEVNRGLETGVDDYVVKPFDPGDLLALVKGKLIRSQTMRVQTEQRYDSYRKRVVHTLSHEFRTPLVAINTGTELLLDQFGALDQPKVKNVLEAIRRGGERLERLVSDFMVLQQIEGGVAEKLYATRRKIRTAREVLSDFFESRRSWFEEEKATCSLHDDSAGALVEIYEPQIQDMLDRLCHNAIKFRSGDAQFEMYCLRAADKVVYEIRDRGIGIDVKRTREALDMFGQLDREKLEQQGSGLGLAITAAYAEIHGGILDFEAREGGGSTVRIVLPLKKS